LTLACMREASCGVLPDDTRYICTTLNIMWTLCIVTFGRHFGLVDLWDVILRGAGMMRCCR
jgi:hypothetical protein